MSKFIKALSNFVLVLTIIILSLYFILRLANVIRIYNVETGSMENQIHAGDYILLFKKNNYYVGDIITYRVKEYFITHRIVRIENDIITTKGDANNAVDSEFNKSQVEGKVIYWGGILNFVINYKFVIIAFLIGMYLLSCYFGDDEEDSKKKEKKKSPIGLDNIKSQGKETVISDTKEEVKENTLIDNNIIKQEEKNEIVEKLIIEEVENKEKIDVLDDNLKDKKKKTSTRKTTTKKKEITDKTSEKKKTSTRKAPVKKKETSDKTSEKKKTSTRKTTTKKKETKNTTQTKRAKSSTDKKTTVSKNKKSSKTKSTK